MTQLTYGAPGSNLSNPLDVIENWLPPRATDRRNESFYRFDLELRLNEVRDNDDFNFLFCLTLAHDLSHAAIETQYLQEVIRKPWRHYEHLLGLWGLECLIKSTWHNNTARNLTASDDLREFRTVLLNWACYPARPGLVEVISRDNAFARGGSPKNSLGPLRLYGARLRKGSRALRNLEITVFYDGTRVSG